MSNLKDKIIYNFNMDDVADWIEEVAPINDNVFFTDGSLAIMKLKYDGKIMEVQLKVTSDENDFLGAARVDLTREE